MRDVQLQRIMSTPSPPQDGFLLGETMLDEHAIEKIVTLAVPKILTGIGFNMNEPTEIQADIKHLRRSREICESVQNNAVNYITKAVVAGIIIALAGYFGWSGLASAVGK